MRPRPKTEINAVVPLGSGTIDVKLPNPPPLLRQKHADRTRSAIMKHGATTPDGKVVYERDALPALFGTDSAWAAQFVAELGNEEYFRDGNKLYIHQPPINKEYSRRIQEPRNAYELERLKDGERCVNAARDAPQLQNIRVTLEARTALEMPQVKKEVLKNASTCISGAPLTKDAEVHHRERVADKPDLALERSNLSPVNPPIHKLIHAERAHTPKKLEALAKREGWPEISGPATE